MDAAQPIKEQFIIENIPAKRRRLESTGNIEPLNPKPKVDPLLIFAECKEQNRPVLIAGPMVRYSKLPFRELVGLYESDFIYTPMILAREFVRHRGGRDSDFTTNLKEQHSRQALSGKKQCLIVQVGANNVTDLLRFVEMIHPYCDAIGLNCGCPVREQVREGIGAALMSDRFKVAKFVKAVKKRWGDKVKMETKIRVHDNVQETIQFVQEVEKAGVDWITIHGRTKDTRSSVPVDLEKIKLVREAIKRVPVVANGDCFKPEDIQRITDYTKVDGVMAVRGVLNNPCLFTMRSEATWGAVERLISSVMEYGLPFQLAQHHVSCMMPKGSAIMNRLNKSLNECTSMVGMLDWFDDNFELRRLRQEGFAEERSFEDARRGGAGEKH
ncbi:tRNA dihydrouridine synthase [Saccharomycopsis crataegensis]|uniref:tRNA-dihydrouridine synthase n=1 Tax=Saccharomycopsis crataegensis TaxID=43959 RepID=A0AAV5QHA6_9ASCO|nr:tRNA dihydrouridine synthase [Saccharomycopsis crataegensis]